MPKEIQIHISSYLDESEWELLRAFCQKVDRLATTKVLSEGCGAIRARLNYDEKKGLCFEIQLPPEEQVVEFLVAFRHFYLEKEPTHFPKVLRLIGKHTKDPDARKALKAAGRQWRDSLFRKAMGITLNETPITTTLLLDLWFNGHYFHSDQDKAEKLEHLVKGFSESFVKYMLLDAAYEATKAILKFHHGVRGIVDSHFNG